MINLLFNEKELIKAASNIEIPDEDFSIIERWMEKLQNKELVGEVKNYLNFFQNFLVRLLGYDENTIAFEESMIRSTGRVEFSFKNKIGQIVAICEVKGQRTDLDHPQSREKDRRTPVEQAFGYALNMKDVNWIIITNYDEFRLYNFERKTKYISFKVEDLRELGNLKLFKSLLSYQTLIEESLPDKVLSNTFSVEKELTARFYDLYHETRLMIIKEFEILGKSLKESLHLAQIILNRVLFVCFAEDSSKGLIESQTLERLLLIPIENKYVDFNGNEIWRTISKFFNDLENGSEIRNLKAFNGGLFAEKLPEIGIRDLIKDLGYFNKVRIEHGFKIPDEIYNKIDKNIIKFLNPIFNNIFIITSFDFETQLTEEILGHVFEQSITDIEILMNENTIIKRIGRRKKEGIYYTPESITRFITERSILGFLGKDKDYPPQDIGSLISEWSESINELKTKVEKLKIIDPACGSGAFLSACVDFLIKLHQAIHEERVVQGEFVEEKGLSLDLWIQNINLQRQIILNNIWGIDINEESVEITKLALFLRVASRDVSLPYLDKRIICGNSLIWDPEYSEHALKIDKVIPEVVNFSEDRLNQEEEYGFDIIIGNPPYIRIQLIPYKEIDFFQKEYVSAYKKFDISILFIERALRLLSKDGISSFITSKQFISSAYGKKIRELLQNHRINFLVDFGGFRVFSEATTYTIIPSITKSTPKDFLCYDGGVSNGKKPLKISDFFTNPFEVSFTSLGIEGWNIIPKNKLNIIKKMLDQSKGKTLEDFSDLPFGVITGKDKIFVISNQTAKNLNLESEIVNPIVMGRDSARWILKPPNKVLIYPYNIDEKGDINLMSENKIKDLYPNTYNYLKKHKNDLISRKDSRKEKGDKEGWFSLMRRGTLPHYFWEQKILVPGTCKKNRFYLDNKGIFYIGKGVTGIIPKEINQYYLLGILNSKLAEFFLHSIAPQKQKGYFTYSKTFLGKLPIIKVEKNVEETISKNVQKIIELIKSRRLEKNNFLKWLKSQFGKNVQLALKKYSKFSQEEFDLRLKKSTKTLNRKDYSLILNEFLQSNQKIKKINEDIKKIEDIIDTNVYDIYNLSEEEINYIKDIIKIDRS